MITEPSTNKNGFEKLDLIAPIRKALSEKCYTQPTQIQLQAIPYLLRGRDLLGCAQTGTGKTGAFAFPILQRLAGKPKTGNRRKVLALILTPTRELAVQIGDSFKQYGRYLDIRHTTVFGGSSYRMQISALSQGVDVLIATPGRLIDLIKRGCVKLDQTEIVVLDEGDRMLDMGFVPDIRKILAMLPENRQTTLFSATMPREILILSKKFLKHPVTISTTPQSAAATNIDQRVMFVDREKKADLLASVFLDQSIKRAVVFTRTRHGANRIARKLNKLKVKAEALHGDKSQNARLLALKKFRSGNARVLVATDVASRGLDIKGVTHIINYELPNEAESYIHRIGRTARAGASGVALSFCDHGERAYLKHIESLTNQAVSIIDDHPYHSDSIARLWRSKKFSSSSNKIRRNKSFRVVLSRKNAKPLSSRGSNKSGRCFNPSSKTRKRITK